MKILKQTVPPELGGLSAEAFLRKAFGLPAGTARQLKFTQGALLVNGLPARGSLILQPGDTVEARLPEKRSSFPAAEGDGLRIVYEDEDLLVVNKPAGLAVHGRSERGDLTLGALVAAHLGSETAFHPVNRLDKETSGLMAVAKHALMHERLRTLLHTPSFRRVYLAVAGGELADAGAILAPLVQEEGSYRRVPADASSLCHAQMALTRFICPFKGPERSFVSILPESGRTHQIRAHMASLGHPLLGDRLYGGETGPIGRTALHSAVLALSLPPEPAWPEGKELLLYAPLPDDMRALLPEGVPVFPEDAAKLLSRFEDLA